MTPWVDIVLVLVIVLIVSVAYVAQSIPLDASGTPGTSEEAVLEIALDAQGRVSIDTEHVSWRELRARARESERAIITADPAAEHGQFVRLLDVLRAEGVRHYALRPRHGGSRAP